MLGILKNFSITELKARNQANNNHNWKFEFMGKVGYA